MSHVDEQGPGLTFLGKLFLLAFIAVCGMGAWWLFAKQGESEAAGSTEGSDTTAENRETGRSGRGTELRIAYGTEKKRWLVWAVERFAETREGKDIEITLLPLGSLEGARATVKGDEEIHVWSPASSAYRDVFVNEWQLEHGGDPIAGEEALALTPMVFVMWKERHDAFIEKYEALDFDSLAEAMVEPGGWNDIAGRPEWGFFKFGHTNPTQSNSGLLALALMSHHFHDKTTPLEAGDIVDASFQIWLRQIEGSVSGLINSTGNMMRDMVLKGPATYDVVLVYENLAIDYLKNAEGRWGQLHVVYPEINLWNDNPYYIIDAPWTDREEKRAAETFLEFLMSEPIQEQSLVHGFRPGNPAIPVIGEESPFEKYERYGIRIGIDTIADPPKADAIHNLLTGWQRLRSSQ